ncbi:putative protein N(5)-glutamine methyltransferase [Kitasatospora sp. NPDC054939]
MRSAVVTRLRSAGCVFAEDEARMLLSAARTPAELAGMVDRRAAGLPLEHVVGWAEFCGLRIDVDPGVFVPRRRTEFLVRQAAALIGRSGRTHSVAVDLCCGTGALGAALATSPVARGGSGSPGTLELHASDIDPAAVACARRNLDGIATDVHRGDLFAPLPDRLRGRVDVLLANVPYVPTGDIGLLPAEAREHEALVALDGGGDGLDVLRRVADGAPQWLAPGGSLLFETGEHQVPFALGVVAGAGLAGRVVESEELYATVVIATRTSEP